MKRPINRSPVLPVTILLLIVSVLFIPNPSLASAGLYVDSTADGISIDGYCSLREAIQAINSHSSVDTCLVDSNTTTINLPPGSYYLTEGSLQVNSDMDIVGSGAQTTILDGNENDRVLSVNNSEVLITGVTISHGKVVTVDKGAGIFISSGSTATIRNSIVRDNSIFSDANAYGAGIFNSGLLTLDHTSVIQNIADGDLAYGGGIFNNNGGNLDLQHSSISGNVANAISNLSLGGGIYNNNGSISSISSSTIQDNQADAGGGGFLDGAVSFESTAFVGNAASDGAAFYQQGGVVDVVNSTFGSNMANRGAIFRFLGQLNLNNSTVANNFGGGIYHTINNGPLTIKNTIVSSNGINCSLEAPLTSAGHNIDSETTCNFNGVGDLSNTNPLIGLLQDNGGETLTFALLVGSPAIDGGDNTGCPFDDQRGYIRDAACDIGSFEFDAAPPVPTTSTPTNTVTPTTTFTVTLTSTETPTSTPTFTVTPTSTQTPTATLAIFPPVDPFPTFNEVKAGKSVPIKFSLGGFQGLSIFASGYPKSEVIVCDSTVPTDGVEETIAAGAGLSYNATTDQYKYGWDTNKAWTGCRQFVMKFIDGSYHRINFSFR